MVDFQLDDAIEIEMLFVQNLVECASLSDRAGEAINAKSYAVDISIISRLS